ncbi:1-acyl-sn-glycerol-3-phosphate acyltransferase [Spirochaetia bacterium]|nr:1-acyl-sn-glycerol-3-phosphate acyltransferase [Spirochaetia bacterium]
MALLKTIWVFSVLAVTLIIMTPVGAALLLLRLVGLKKFTALVTGKIVRYWARFLVLLTGCKPVVVGAENVPRKGGLCVVSNHGSIFDVVLLLAYSGRSFAFIAKKELSLVPLLNIWIVLIEGLFIDRKSIRKSVRTINKGIQQIKEGSAMIIFPEGHRSRGQGLLPFHSGSFKLATASEAPIIPVAITGSYDVFEKTYRVCAAPVRVVFGTPINTAEISQEDRRQVLAEKVRDVIAEAMDGNK